MKILITGYKGFIGQNMVNALRSKHELIYFEWGEQTPVIKGLDWVIHLGAISSTTENNIEKIMKQNYDFSVWLLNECLSQNVNLQYSSSASVYGPTDTFKEDSPLNPQSPYSWSKYLFDRYMSNQQDSNRLKNIYVQGFRYFNVYGPHEDHKGDQASPYFKFEQQAKNTGVIKIFENSENYRRDFVHVDTVVDVHSKFLNVKESGIWNIGTGKPKSFKDVAEEIAAKYSAKIEYIKMPDIIAKQYQKYTCADMTKTYTSLKQ